MNNLPEAIANEFTNKKLYPASTLLSDDYKLGFTEGIQKFIENNIIYAFQYNSCIYESGYVTISLHWTKEGAEKALAIHKQQKLDEYNESYGENCDFEFGDDEGWQVKPMIILP